MAATFIARIVGDSKRQIMRFAQGCLVTIVLLMPFRSAHADIQANCASIAANFANSNATNVDLWLRQFRESYELCRSQHEAPNELSVPRKESEETVVKPTYEKPPAQTANKKAVFKNVKIRPEKSIFTRLPERPILFREYKRKKLVKSKPAGKIEARQKKTPLKIVPKIRPNTGRSVGDEGWRINCSARFGGFNKNSEWYISSAGKRVSCLILP